MVVDSTEGPTGDIVLQIKDATGLLTMIENMEKRPQGDSVAAHFSSIITTATSNVTSIDPTTLTYQDFVALYSKLDPAYVNSAAYVMNSNTRGLILGLTDTLGRPCSCRL